MAKRKPKKRKAVPPPTAASKKIPRKMVPVAAAGRKRPAPGLDVRAVLSGWTERLGVAEYSGRQWGRLALLAAGLLVLVFYSFSAGGYFVIRRSYGELIVLWLVVVGLLFELRARGKMPQLGKIELGFFAGYSVWIGLSVLWSITPARSLEEFVRAVLYLGGFGLVYLYMARREWLGWMGHLFVAIAAVVAIDALLGKTIPELVTHPDPFQSNRINYPLTYWNTMALLMSMSFILGLRVLASRATHVAVRSIYAPVMFLNLVVLWFTFSRAVIVLLAAVFCLYLYLAVSRLRAVMQSALLVIWTAAVVAMSFAFLPNMVASVPDQVQKASEGHLLALVLVLFMAVAAASQFVIFKLEDRISISPELGRKIGFGIAGSFAALLVVAVLALSFAGGRGGPVSFVQTQLSGVSEKGQAVERPSERLFSLKSERFQEYGASLKRFAEQPLQGTGAGTWFIAWFKYRPWDIGVKDGHSWFFETMAELGLVGTLLLVGFVGTFLAVAIRDLRFLWMRPDRELYGAFFATCVLFLLHAMIDWDWEMPIISLPFFMFAGGMLHFGQLARSEAADNSGEAEEKTAGAGIRRFGGWTLPLIAGGIVAMAITMVPLIAETKIQGVQNMASAPRRDVSAIELAAQSAGAWAPLDAKPLMFQSLAEQLKGDLGEAERLMLRARDKEPENDMIYRRLTRIYLLQNGNAQKSGDTEAQQASANKALDAIVMSRQLNPLESYETGDLENQVRKLGVVVPPPPRVVGS